MLFASWSGRVTLVRSRIKVQHDPAVALGRCVWAHSEQTAAHGSSKWLSLQFPAVQTEMMRARVNVSAEGSVKIVCANVDINVFQYGNCNIRRV